MRGWASVQYGTWYTRSPEFLQTGLMNVLHWMRIPGDSLLALGASVQGWFVFGLWSGASYDPMRGTVEEGESELVGR